jgi:hypothetical protein
MPGLTLSDIVSSALSKAESGLKLASARDAEPAGDPGDFLSDLLPITKRASEDTPFEGDDEKSREKRKEKKEEKEETKESALADVDFAFKLAEALEAGSSIVTKIAEGTVHDAPGPAVSESGFITTATASPKATSKVTDRFSGGKLHPAGQDTNKEEFTSPGDDSGAPKNEPGKTAGWTKDKTAANRLLRAKMAQAETLMSLGLIDQAEAIMQQVKAAQDPSSPPPSMPGHSDSFKLDTEPGPSSHIPDNAGLISMTRSQARDATTRETTKHFSEPPKKDPAVGAHTLTTEGQKLSSAIRKRASSHEESKPEKTEKAEAKKDKKDDKDEEKTSAAARAYIKRAFDVYNDEDAPVEERQKAASILTSIKSKLGVDPATLLG